MKKSKSRLIHEFYKHPQNQARLVKKTFLNTNFGIDSTHIKAKLNLVGGVEEPVMFFYLSTTCKY